MAYLGLNKETLDSPLEWGVCLPKEDCLLIQKSLKHDVFVAKKQYERLKKLHESGSVTDSQKQSFVLAEKRYASLRSIIHAIDELLRESPYP